MGVGFGSLCTSYILESVERSFGNVTPNFLGILHRILKSMEYLDKKLMISQRFANGVMIERMISKEA